jgi:type II secretory pathway component GspD/PulD (secretin)
MKKTSFITLNAIALIVLLTGCTTQKYQDITNERLKSSKADLDSGVAKIEERKAEIPLYQRMPGLWISDRVVAQSASQRLPAQFDKQFVLREQGALTLSDIADAVRSSTGMNISLQGEALGLANQRFPIDHVGSLQGLLDSAAARTGVTWSWENSTVMIQQSVARTFPVRRAGIEAVKAAATTSATNNAAGATSPAATSTSAAAVSDPYAELSAAIKVISPSARVSIMKTASAITVSDTPASVKRIADLLEFDDRQSTKQVTLLWRLINFTANDNAEAGVDIQYLLARSGGILSLGSATGFGGVNAGVLKLASTSGTSNGSSIALKLLNEIGNAHIIKSGVSTLKNNGRDDISNEKEIFYLSKTTPGTSSGGLLGGTTSVGIEQASVKVGLSGAFAVSIYDSERMDLSFDFSVAFLDQLKSITSAGQTLQSPEVSRRSGRGVVPVKHGETWILTSQSTDGDSYDRRGLFPNTILGGSERGSSTREQWMLIVTPVITQKGI